MRSVGASHMYSKRLLHLKEPFLIIFYHEVAVQHLCDLYDGSFHLYRVVCGGSALHETFYGAHNAVDVYDRRTWSVPCAIFCIRYPEEHATRFGKCRILRLVLFSGFATTLGFAFPMPVSIIVFCTATFVWCMFYTFTAAFVSMLVCFMPVRVH